MNTTTKKAIIITGMHRSGTSLLSNLFYKIGWDIGKNILEPHLNNPVGFFENKLINEINDKILSLNNASWSFPINLDNFIINDEITNEIINIVNTEFIFDNILIKDPRISLLLKFWTPILQNIGFTVYQIHIFRNPQDVCNSLNIRDWFSYFHTSLLYQVYNYEAISNKVEKFYLINLENLLTKPEIVLIKFFNQVLNLIPPNNLPQIIELTIQHRLIHSKSTSFNNTLSNGSINIYQKLTKGDLNNFQKCVDKNLINSELYNISLSAFCNGVLYFSNDTTFNNRNTIEKKYTASNFCFIEFDLPYYVDNLHLRFDPDESACICNIIQAQYLIENINLWENLLISDCNDVLNNNREFIFSHNDPMIFFNPVQQNISKVRFKLMTIKINETVFKSNFLSNLKNEYYNNIGHLKLLNEQLESKNLDLVNLNQQLESKNIDLVNLKNAFSTKLGFILTMPARKIIKYINCLNKKCNLVFASSSVFLNKIYNKIYFRFKYDESFNYNIDSFYCWRNNIYLRGWAYHANCVSKINLLSSDERKLIHSFIPNQDRLDVIKHLNLDTSYKKKLGFDTFFNIESITQNNFILQFYSGNIFISIPIVFSNRLNIENLNYEDQYKIYQQQNDKINKDGIVKEISKFSLLPKFSIVIPTYNSHPKYIREALESVINQIYENWEICIYDDCSTNTEFYEIIYYYIRKFGNKIKFNIGTKNLNISLATNKAINESSGDYIVLLDHDDIISADALYEVAKSVNINPDFTLIYSDEDKINDKSIKFSPHFKSDFNYDLLLSVNYICHLLVIKKFIGDKIGWFRKGYEGAQDHDLILRIVEIIDHKQIYHISKVLYSWRAIEGSTAYDYNDKAYAKLAGKKAIESHLNNNNIIAQVEYGKINGSYTVNRDIIDYSNEVTIIIPFKDNVKYLIAVVDSIYEKTRYKNFTLLLINNRSVLNETYKYLDKIKNIKNLKTVFYDNEFNYSKMHNWAVKNHCHTEYILFLNNDMKVISKNWLTILISHAQRKEVGAVGALLLYEDNTIQHAGVVIGLGGIAGHINKNINYNENGYMSFHKLTQNFNACTGACLLMKTNTFYEAGTFDEKLEVAFNDVDLCLKIRSLGLSIVYEPRCLLYHYESKSRGLDDTIVKNTRFLNECQAFETKWPNYNDKYFNDNFSLDYNKITFKINEFIH